MSADARLYIMRRLAGHEKAHFEYMPASSGSAMVNPFEAIATTTSFAAIPMRSRY